MSRLERALPILALFAIGTISWTPDAQAGAVEDAEHIRLTEEMRRLAKRNAWKGVESAYVELEKLESRGATLNFEDHYLGAQAARALGDINAVYKRLTRAVGAGGGKDEIREVMEWLNDLNANYGQVQLANKTRKVASLTPSQMPFAPDKRNTIVAAQTDLAADGEYRGLLPAGEYQFGTLTFVVNAGQPEALYTYQEAKPPKGEQEPYKMAYVGLRADVAAAWLGAGAPGEADGGPDAFSGFGPRVGVGLQAGLTRSGTVGVVVEVGYHGLFGGPPEGMEEEPGSRLQSGYLWLGPDLRFKKLDVAVGPVWSVGKAAVSGPSSGGYAMYDEATGDWTAPLASRYEATPMIIGPALGVSYALAKLGSYQGALGLTGGTQFDSARMYSWGQVGLTVTPATLRRD